MYPPVMPASAANPTIPVNQPKVPAIPMNMSWLIRP